jgi:hypothetical protein
MSSSARGGISADVVPPALHPPSITARSGGGSPRRTIGAAIAATGSASGKFDPFENTTAKWNHAVPDSGAVQTSRAALVRRDDEPPFALAHVLSRGDVAPHRHRVDATALVLHRGELARRAERPDRAPVVADDLRGVCGVDEALGPADRDRGLAQRIVLGDEALELDVRGGARVTDRAREPVAERAGEATAAAAAAVSGRIELVGELERVRARRDQEERDHGHVSLLSPRAQHASAIQFGSIVLR